MEEKKQLKNFKCQNPDCGHEFLADEFEALECPVCHTDEIAPRRPPLTKYILIGFSVLLAIWMIYKYFDTVEIHDLKCHYDKKNCKLIAIVDDLAKQPYYYKLDNGNPTLNSEFQDVGNGAHIISIYSKDNYPTNLNEEPIATDTVLVTNSCIDNNNGNSSQKPQVQLQFLGIETGAKGLKIRYAGGQGTDFEFSITGIKGKYQKEPEFPDAKCKIYQPGDMVVKCVKTGEIDTSTGPLQFSGCKQIVSNAPLPPNGENTKISSLFNCLMDGSCGIGDGYDINPGDMSAPIKVFHSNSSPETVPFYDYMVRLKADKTIKINKVTSDYKWGTNAKGKQVPVPINIKVYEAN